MVKNKNKKNKNQNKFVIDDDNFNQNDNNAEPFESIPNKKKNVFEQLQNSLSVSDDEYCDECGNTPCDGVHAIHDVDAIHETQTDKKDDFYFSRAYHSDDYEHDYENAITLYKLSIDNDSDFYKAIASYNLALIYDEKYKDYEKAEYYYKFSCEKKYTGAFLNLGLLYFNQKTYTNAIPYLKKAIDFGYIKIYYEYAFCLEKSGQKDEAMKYLQYHLMLKNASDTEKKLWKRLINFTI
jgi:tetratricopeptide (TPR) repeat protein